MSFGSLSPSGIPEIIIGMNLKDAQQLLSGTGKLIQVVKIGDRVTPDHNPHQPPSSGNVVANALISTTAFALPHAQIEIRTATSRLDMCS